MGEVKGWGLEDGGMEDGRVRGWGGLEDGG